MTPIFKDAKTSIKKYGRANRHCRRPYRKRRVRRCKVLSRLAPPSDRLKRIEEKKARALKALDLFRLMRKNIAV